MTHHKNQDQKKNHESEKKNAQSVQTDDVKPCKGKECKHVIAEEELQKKLDETKSIAMKAQHDYINLKMDFDHLLERTEQRQKQQELDTLLDVVRKFFPFIESLRKSIAAIPENLREDPLSRGVQMTYTNFISILESMAIFPIESLGLSPDTTLHEPVSMQNIEDATQKGKIITELER